jgi:hypothetical protein
MLENLSPTIALSCKKILKTCLLFTLPLLFIFKTAQAQNNNQTVYVGVNYIKVTPGKGSVYNDLLRTYSRKINEDYFKAGKILGWYVNYVLMPTGSSAEYDMTIVTVTTDMSLLVDDTTSIRERFKKVLPGASDATIEMIFDAYAGSRILVKKEIYSFVDGVNLSSNPSKYTKVDFMKATPGKETDYVKLEKEIFKPLHTEMVKKGSMDDWGFYALEMPNSSAGAYDYLTANFFTSLNQSNGVNYNEIFKKVFPKMDMTAVWTQTNNARKMIRSEIWKLGVYVDGTNTK